MCRRRVNAQSVCFVGVDELFSHGNVCGVSACCPSICNDSVEHRFVSCSDVFDLQKIVLWFQTQCCAVMRGCIEFQPTHVDCVFSRVALCCVFFVAQSGLEHNCSAPRCVAMLCRLAMS